MPEPKLTEAQLRELGPWNSRLLEQTVARMVAEAEQAARAEGYEHGVQDAWQAACDADKRPATP